MGNPKREAITFIGAGLDASSWLINDDNDWGPHRPLGATWPFASLTVDGKSTRLRIRLLFVDNSAKPADVTVTLGKIGYVYFKHKDKSKDFGFCTLRLDALLSVLRKHGYKLDRSCERNLRISKIFMYSWTALGVGFFLLVTVMSIIRPNG